MSFADIATLDAQTIERIRRVGTVVIHGIVEESEARKWKDELKEFVTINTTVEGSDTLWMPSSSRLIEP